MRRVSVVIPTFNRKDILTRAIRAHLAQSALDELQEILVIDDGSTDGTEALVAALSNESTVPIRYWRQANGGQAAARNLGIREARGEIILFTDDDIIAAPNLLAEHLRWHNREPAAEAAVLGLVTWSPEVRPTPFMQWFGLDGPLFDYARFSGKIELDFRAFYTCNLSLKTELLRRTGGFDEDFKGYGFEDAELGYRLEKNGMRLLYNPAALAYHYKHVTFAEACRREKQVVKAFRILEQKEAGKYLVELMEREREKPARKGLVRRLVDPLLVPVKWAILNAARLVVDSRIPLPWSLYRKLFTAATTSRSQEPHG